MSHCCEGCIDYVPDSIRAKCKNVTAVNRIGWNPLPTCRCAEYSTTNRFANLIDQRKDEKLAGNKKAAGAVSRNKRSKVH